MYRVFKRRAFTLVEILVSIVLIGIGLSATIGILISGTFYLKQAQLKSEAMSAASTQMERYLAKSYGSLEEGMFEGQTESIDWEVKVEEEYEGGCSAGSLCIPYKEITVSAFYTEEAPSGEEILKRIQLKNIVPYPYIHIASTSIDNISQEVGPAPYQSIKGLSLDLSYPVDKDIMVIYNIAIEVEDTTGIQADDTILTSCFLDGKQRLIETRTPIMTQPLINNIIEVDAQADGVTRNAQHRVQIKWHKITNVAGAGKISLKKANLIVVAFEAKK